MYDQGDSIRLGTEPYDGLHVTVTNGGGGFVSIIQRENVYYAWNGKSYRVLEKITRVSFKYHFFPLMFAA